MVKSFFLNESGFVAPWTALSWSWISGILVGAATLFGTVSPAIAHHIICSKFCCGVNVVLVCEGCSIWCYQVDGWCYTFGECS